MVSQKYRGSCIGAALAKWLAKNPVASQKMALEEKMEDGALEMLLELLTNLTFYCWAYQARLAHPSYAYPFSAGQAYME